MGRKYSISLGIYIVIVIVLVYDFTTTNTKWGDFLSYLGTWTSIYALIITFFQLKTVLDQAKETNLIISKTKQKYDQLISIEDISKYIEIAKRIPKDIRDNKDDLAQLRLEDLKDIVYKINKPNIIDASLVEKYNYSLQCIRDIYSDFQIHIDDGSQLNIKIFNEKIISIIEFFNELKNKINIPC